jgi:hypothetical protein
MDHYVELLGLNVWCRSEIDGENAVYDGRRWTVAVTRHDGSQRIFHPKYLMVAGGFNSFSSYTCPKAGAFTVGVTGELPKLPHVPGLQEFEAAGGAVVHSSRHKTTPDMKGKKAIIVGAATSAHDLGWELYERGLDVTMIQVG